MRQNGAAACRHVAGSAKGRKPINAAEFGLTVAKGPKQVNEVLQRLASGKGVPALAREMVGVLASQLDGLDTKLKTIE